MTNIDRLGKKAFSAPWPSSSTIGKRGCALTLDNQSLRNRTPEIVQSRFVPVPFANEDRNMRIDPWNTWLKI